MPWQQIEDLAAAVRRQRFCQDLFYRGQAEHTHSATHEATGLTVKVRPDLMIPSLKTGRVVPVDFKPTSAQDYAHFVVTIEQYDYDRQVAPYSDLSGAARFIIIGVQKLRIIYQPDNRCKYPIVLTQSVATRLYLRFSLKNKRPFPQQEKSFFSRGRARSSLTL